MASKVKIINTIISLPQYKDYFNKGTFPPDEIYKEIYRTACGQDTSFIKITDFKNWVSDNWGKLEINGTRLDNFKVDLSEVAPEKRRTGDNYPRGISGGNPFYG